MAHDKKKPVETNFFQDVYDVVALIPKGRVTSYGAIAHYLGTKSGARMVGWAMNNCPKGVPAHRVVNRAGFTHRQTSFQNTADHAKPTGERSRKSRQRQNPMLHRNILGSRERTLVEMKP